LSHVDVRVEDPRRTLFQKKVAIIGDSSDSEDEAKIGLAEWTRNNKPILCPFAKKDIEKYGFDITKADRIFDLLLQEGQIKLSPNHTIPSVEELKTTNIASGTMLCPIIPTNARPSVSRSSRLLSKEGSNSKIL
jgi:hypothetical protein